MYTKIVIDPNLSGYIEISRSGPIQVQFIRLQSSYPAGGRPDNFIVKLSGLGLGLRLGFGVRVRVRL